MLEESQRDSLLRMVNGYQVSQAIHVASVLGVADALNSPMTKSLFDQSISGATVMTSIVVSPLISAMMAIATATSD